MPPGRPTARAGLVTTAFVFSAFHLDPVGFLARFELGLLFGLFFFRTGSLWPGIAAHAANNLVSTGSCTSPRRTRPEAEPQLAQIR